MALKNPLRYPGSKRWASGHIESAITGNSLSPLLYIEPFAGGASVAIDLLSRGVVENIGLIDKDPFIASFWKAVFFDTKWLVREISRVPVTVDQWLEFRNSKKKDARSMAIACLFLNRTSFSGIIHGGGPIGGMSQRSDYKIGCRFNKEEIIGRVLRVSELAPGVMFIWNVPWIDAIPSIRKGYEKYIGVNNIAYYIDPPYFEKGEMLYKHCFERRDHMALRRSIDDIRSPFFVSYDDAIDIRYMYKKFNSMIISRTYTSSGWGFRPIKNELLISNMYLGGISPGNESALIDVPWSSKRFRMPKWVAMELREKGVI